MEMTSKEVTCPWCGLIELAPEEMIKHMDDYHDKAAAAELECPMCSFTSFLPETLELHINNTHLDQECSFSTSFNCPFCKNIFYDSVVLQMHVDTDHKENVAHICPVCERCDFVSSEEVALHVDSHFVAREKTHSSTFTQEMERREREKKHWEEEQEFQRLKTQYGMNDNGGFKRQRATDMQRAVQHGNMSVADYHEREVQLRAKEWQGIDDQGSCTKGLIPLIREQSGQNPVTARVYLCSDLDHYQSTYGDKGWGCGYRNLQMLISSLSKHKKYAEHLAAVFGTIVMPSIPRLQQQIEAAWSEGFDLQGSKQLGFKLHKTSKWIGATEIVAFLSSLRIKCQLVDFHRPTAVDGGHPELFKWILQYFQQHADFIPPLYLQHEGHSRTVVGIEQLSQHRLQLLLFDPSHSLNRLKNSSFVNQTMRLIRRQYAAMKYKQYQIVAVTGIMANSDEYQRSKVLQSKRIPHENRL